MTNTSQPSEHERMGSITRSARTLTPFRLTSLPLRRKTPQHRTQHTSITSPNLAIKPTHPFIIANPHLPTLPYRNYRDSICGLRWWGRVYLLRDG
jgi:hypothetical protein